MSRAFRLLLLLALCAGLAPLGQAAGNEALKPGILAALERVEKRMAAREVHGDMGFLLVQAAKRKGRKVDVRPLAQLLANKDRYPYSLEFGLWQLRDANLVPGPYALPPPRTLRRAQYHAAGSAEAVVEDGARQAKWVAAILANVLQCRSSGPVRELVGEPNHEYILSHQVIALLIAGSRGCVAPKALQAALPLYVGNMRDEFFAEERDQVPLTDLQVERAAMLCMAGQCRQLPAAFLRRLLQAQGRDGLWKLRDPLVTRGVMPPEHATGLAYYALALSLP